MILGLSVHTFTIIHVLISLVGIVAGVIVAFAMVQGKSVPGWTALALLALVLTSVTGFFFHNTTFTPAQGVGIISLVVLAVAVIALYFLHLTGIWRWLYVIAAMIANTSHGGCLRQPDRHGSNCDDAVEVLGKDRVVRRLYDRRVVLSGVIARQSFDASAPRTGRSSINL